MCRLHLDGFLWLYNSKHFLPVKIRRSCCEVVSSITGNIYPELIISNLYLLDVETKLPLSSSPGLELWLGKVSAPVEWRGACEVTNKLVLADASVPNRLQDQRKRKVAYLSFHYAYDRCPTCVCKVIKSRWCSA